MNPPEGSQGTNCNGANKTAAIPGKDNHGPKGGRRSANLFRRNQRICNMRVGDVRKVMGFKREKRVSVELLVFGVWVARIFCWMWFCRIVVELLVF